GKSLLRPRRPRLDSACAKCNVPDFRLAPSRVSHIGFQYGSFDFLAAYIVFEDAWYIIPEEEVQGMENISLHTETSRANYEKHRQAWNLLDSDPVGGHIDSIQACAEEFSSDWANEDGGSFRMTGDFFRFSSALHREVSSSTASAQAPNAFLLRLPTICRRVGSPKTWDLLRLAER
ncbi:MAG: hypothetical protein WCB72_11085, partial [Candidatus Sulfotelmatobacter sp.]